MVILLYTLHIFNVHCMIARGRRWPCRSCCLESQIPILNYRSSTQHLAAALPITCPWRLVPVHRVLGRRSRRSVCVTSTRNVGSWRALPANPRAFYINTMTCCCCHVDAAYRPTSAPRTPLTRRHGCMQACFSNCSFRASACLLFLPLIHGSLVGIPCAPPVCNPLSNVYARE